MALPLWRFARGESVMAAGGGGVDGGAVGVLSFYRCGWDDGDMRQLGVLLAAGALARVPDESWEEWKRIMGELEAGGVGSVAITPATAAAM